MKYFLKTLTYPLYKKGGRNKQGRITVYGRGGGVRKRYRFIDFKRTLFPRLSAVVKTIERETNRTSYISLIIWTNGFITYVLATENLNIGTIIYNDNRNLSKFNLASSSRLKYVPNGALIHNISLASNKNGQIIRAAGGSALLLKGAPLKYSHFKRIKLKSGELKLIHELNMATIGVISNSSHHLKKLNKAGQTRHIGRVPRSRASAKNPVDHPMGGRTKGGSQETNKNGLILKGSSKPHKFHKKNKNFILIGHRKNKFLKR
jgi:large subunit ribosomal protein L2